VGVYELQSNAKIQVLLASQSSARCSFFHLLMLRLLQRTSSLQKALGFDSPCCACSVTLLGQILILQVNGDSGNDIELFQVPGVRGCVVSNAHPELRQWATAALDPSTGSSATPATLHIAQQPCAGGIVEALLLFGSVQNPPQPESLLRGFVTELGLLQSNALAGNLALLAEPGAAWVTPAGRVLQVVQCMGEPADAAAAGLTWVDRICVRPLLQKGGTAAADAPAGAAVSSSSSGVNVADSIGEGELLVVTYQLWSFKGQSRDSSRVRQCSAVVRAMQPGAADGFKLLHLHEGVMAQDVTATAAFAALAATSP
jgi:hypothetical protein